MEVKIRGDSYRGNKPILWVDEAPWALDMTYKGFVLVETTAEQGWAEELDPEEFKKLLSGRSCGSKLLTHYTVPQLIEAIIAAADAAGLPKITGRGAWTRGAGFMVGDGKSMYELSIDSKKTKDGLRKEIRLDFSRHLSGHRYPYQDVWFTEDGRLGFPFWKAQALALKWGPAIAKAAKYLREHRGGTYYHKYGSNLQAMFAGENLAPIIGPEYR